MDRVNHKKIGFVMFIMAVVLLPIWSVLAAPEGRATVITNGTWTDGGNSYNANNVSFSAGISRPVISSFSTKSIAPSYYFDRQLRVNSQGFTTMGGTYTNPAAIAYTTLSNDESFQSHNLSLGYHGTPVWFHNGLDGISFHHQSSFAGQIDPSYIEGLGLDRVTLAGRQTEVCYSDSTRLQTREIYKTRTGLEIDYAAFQSQAFINENLKNMSEGGHSTKSERRNPDDALSNAAAQVNYYSLGNGNVIMAINSPEDFFHWNYSSGAYVQPGDVLYYEGNQKIEGFGTSNDFQQLNYYVHDISKRGVGEVDVSGNLISTEGHVKNMPPEIKWGQFGPTLYGKKGQASFRNGYIEPKYVDMAKYEDFSLKLPVSLVYENDNGNWKLDLHNLDLAKEWDGSLDAEVKIMSGNIAKPFAIKFDLFYPNAAQEGRNKSVVVDESKFGNKDGISVKPPEIRPFLEIKQEGK